jgi:hypothetical protein
MLNGHTGPILDLAVSPLCSALPGGQATRIVISVGSDGRVIFWRILNEFTAETTTSAFLPFSQATSETGLTTLLTREQF